MPDVKGWQTKKDLPRVIDWIKTIQPDSEGEPIAAIKEAFKLDPPPDIIFFITDGVIDNKGKEIGKTLVAVDQLNNKMVLVKDKNGQAVVNRNTGKALMRRSVLIHTIQLQVPDFDKVSLLLSQWDGKKGQPVAIAQLIARLKLARPGQRPREEIMSEQFQAHQMQMIARRNGGECRYFLYAVAAKLGK
jgi:hypothetical protein